MAAPWARSGPRERPGRRGHELGEAVPGGGAAHAAERDDAEDIEPAAAHAGGPPRERHPA